MPQSAGCNDYAYMNRRVKRTAFRISAGFLVLSGIAIGAFALWAAFEFHVRPLRWPTSIAEVTGPADPSSDRVPVEYTIHGYPRRAWMNVGLELNAPDGAARFRQGSKHTVRYDPQDFGTVRLYGNRSWRAASAPFLFLLFSFACVMAGLLLWRDARQLRAV